MREPELSRLELPPPLRLDPLELLSLELLRLEPLLRLELPLLPRLELLELLLELLLLLPPLRRPCAFAIVRLIRPKLSTISAMKNSLRFFRIVEKLISGIVGYI